MMIFNPTHWADETHDHLVYKEIYPLSYMVQITIHRTIYTTSEVQLEGASKGYYQL